MQSYGIRRITTLALLLLAAGTGLSTWMNAPWQMDLYWGIIVGIGSGLLSTVFGTVVTERWFVKHRGMVIGIMCTAGSMGQLVILPIFSWLLHIYDWQIAVRAISIIIMAFIAPVLIFMRNQPGDIGIDGLWRRRLAWCFR